MAGALGLVGGAGDGDMGAEDGSGDDGDGELGVAVVVVVGRMWWLGEEAWGSVGRRESSAVGLAGGVGARGEAS